MKIIKIIKEAKRSEFKNDDGILSSKIDDKTTLEVSQFYSEAPFPNYQGYENRFVLSKIVTENIFLNDLKNHIRFNKRFIEVGSGTCQLSLAMAIGGNSLIVAMDPTKESLKLGKEFAEKNNISNVVFLIPIFSMTKSKMLFLMWFGAVEFYTTQKIQRKVLK